MTCVQNPFPSADPDRHALWEMLVRKDIEAFVASDWAIVQDDFLEEEFVGIDAKGLDNPDGWRVTFPSLNVYRDIWLSSSREIMQRNYHKEPRQALFEAITLGHIDVVGIHALLHKKFDGWLEPVEGKPIPLKWQTLYRCRKVQGRWRITGFDGYLPNPMGSALKCESAVPARFGKRLPEKAMQHRTAGPYSPVLEVDATRIVVISGQAAIDLNGKVIGENIEEQAELTLENCRLQLESAGSSLDEVFKVNVYLTDLQLWSRFNEVYRRTMPEPRPVRTAIQAGLLPGLLVEIEMWSVRSE